MNGKKFYQILACIVGEDNAELYSKRFGPLDEPQNDTILNYEALAVYAYSTELLWHQQINDELWSGNPSPEVAAFTAVLNGVLAKLPPHTLNRGVVYRGYNTENIDEFLTKYALGSKIHFPAFTSASFREELAFGGNILFTIRTLTGKAIWYLAAKFDEYEVLIPAGTTFNVLNVERRANRAVIALEEVDGR
jgi:hypothetical protein